MKIKLNKYFIYKQKNRPGIVVFLLFMFSIWQPLYAQNKDNLSVHASVDTMQIKIGEQLHLTLQAVTDADNPGVGWATIPDTFNHLMVVSRSPVDTIKNKEQLIYQQKITLTGFDSGRWYIPSFRFHPLTIKDSSEPENYKTDSLAIFVHTVQVDTTKPFRPIKEIRVVPFNLWDYWPYLLCGFIILLVILFFVFIYKKKNKSPEEENIPQEPPYDQAVKNLRSLENAMLWQKGEVKEYYSRLTDILRLYIQRQYHIHAMEQTSDELLDKIKQVTRLNQQREPLRYILQTADLAKFAKLMPLPEEHEGCMTKARNFIEWTKPQPEKEEENKSKK